MRLVTRADFDGLVCGALVTKLEPIDSYLYVEPKFMQDGLVEIRKGDIITNLPYHPNCTLWFDHHITNTTPNFPQPIVIGKGGFRLAPSAARVVCEYYTELAERSETAVRAQHPPQDGSATTFKADAVPLQPEEILAFLNTERMKYLLHEADRIDAGKLEMNDVLDPQGYVLISMTTDGRNAGDEPYWLKIINLLRDSTLEETLNDPDVKGRCQRIRDEQEKLQKLLLERTTMKGNVIYCDLRGVKEIPDGNRFLIFTLFPRGNISMKITDDTQVQNRVAISVSYNIFNSTSKVNVGALLEKHGGGGHWVVGSCRVPKGEAEKHIGEIFDGIRDQEYN